MALMAVCGALLLAGLAAGVAWRERSFCAPVADGHLSAPEVARRFVWYLALALFRTVDEHRPTVLFDEVDAIFGPKATEHEDLRSLINAGHRKGSKVHRMVGQGANMTVKEFNVYAAVATAGIGLPPDTVLDRAVPERMRRRAPDEHVEPFRFRRVRQDAEPLRQRLEAWAAGVFDSLAMTEPAMPEQLTDRQADVAEPLLAIADAAGGAWPERAREAMVALFRERDEEEQSWGVRLLTDVS